MLQDGESCISRMRIGNEHLLHDHFTQYTTTNPNPPFQKSSPHVFKIIFDNFFKIHLKAGRKTRTTKQVNDYNKSYNSMPAH